LFAHRFSWGENRVFYLNQRGELQSLPAQWTSVYQQDPFVLISKEKSFFHLEKLLELVELIKKLKENKPVSKVVIDQSDV
jgi:hypothetical protein